jgi:hypothetical protein
VTVRFIATGREIAHAEIVRGWLLWLGNNGGACVGSSFAYETSLAGEWRSESAAAGEVYLTIEAMASAEMPARRTAP